MWDSKLTKIRLERRKSDKVIDRVRAIPGWGEGWGGRGVNLVAVDIPEGVERIGKMAFYRCYSLNTVSFPTKLTSIGRHAFYNCYILENVNLLHTNLQELGQLAFCECSELKSMTIPDSLQTLDKRIFYYCSKLVPSSIDVSINAIVTTPRSENMPAGGPPISSLLISPWVLRAFVIVPSVNAVVRLPYLPDDVNINW